MRKFHLPSVCCIFFFFNDTATTEIYTLSLHDALPISTTPTASCAPGTTWPSCWSPWSWSSAPTSWRASSSAARGDGRNEGQNPPARDPDRRTRSVGTGRRTGLGGSALRPGAERRRVGAGQDQPRRPRRPRRYPRQDGRGLRPVGRARRLGGAHGRLGATAARRPVPVRDRALRHAEDPGAAVDRAPARLWYDAGGLLRRAARLLSDHGARHGGRARRGPDARDGGAIARRDDLAALLEGAPAGDRPLGARRDASRRRVLPARRPRS